MIKIINQGSGTLIRGYNVSEDFSIIVIARDNIISRGTTGTVTVGDASVTQSTTSIVDHEFDISVNIPLNARSQSYTLNNLTSSIISISGNSATRISDGLAEVNVNTALGNRLGTFSVSRQSPTTTNVFNNFIAGSLAKAISDTIDASISGKTQGDPYYFPGVSWPPATAVTGTNQSLFSTWNPSTQSITRNSGLFVSSIDWSCLAASYANGGGFGGTLISPRHFITANHNLLNGNAIGTLQFVDSSNNVRSATVSSGSFVNIAGTDITVVKLNADVPSGINFAKVLPANFRTKLPNIQYGIPCIMGDQFKTFRIGEWNNVASPGNFAFIGTPKVSGRIPWYNTPVGGDSSSPSFLIISGAPVVLTCWSTASGGGNYADYITEINAAMTTLGGGYQLTTVDLSGFTSF